MFISTKGEILNQKDELIGNYTQVTKNQFWVVIDGIGNTMSRKTFESKIKELNLVLDQNI